MRRHYIWISSVALLIGVSFCAMLFLPREMMCEVPFIYQIGDGTLADDSGEEWTRNVVKDKICSYFSTWKSDSFDKEAVENCIANKGFSKGEEPDILDVLSRKALFADTPTCSYAVRCSLRLCASGRIASRLQSIADVCMEGFRKTLSESNVLTHDRAAYREYQEKFSRERRIHELEHTSSGAADPQLSAEIQAERDRVAELEKIIAEIGKAVDKRRGERLLMITDKKYQDVRDGTTTGLSLGIGG